MEINPDISYGDWTPSLETVTENIDLTQVRKLASVLDLDEADFDDGAALPPMWHWLFFLHRAPTAHIGPDGHPKRGGFFPPVELQRRMFAGERIKFHAPLRVGQPATRTGTITSLDEKQGRNGRMVLASAQYRIEQAGALCVEDTHNIIYIAGGGATPAPGADAFTPPEGAWHRQIKADSVFLYRYSALSFNSHRIHYDRDYAQNEEGYPGLVVHGPLTALLLAELARAHVDAPMTEFTFRGRAPMFEPWPFHLVGQPGDDGSAELQAVRNDATVAMTATAQFG
ncbi:MAG: acyl-CoA dehydrogenase [Alphaproteobacteria bacterium]|nr:acyl-CoA dehydrogenase [Alphaproteobacteria bacterium]